MESCVWLGLSSLIDITPVGSYGSLRSDGHASTRKQVCAVTNEERFVNDVCACVCVRVCGCVRVNINTLIPTDRQEHYFHWPPVVFIPMLASVRNI